MSSASPDPNCRPLGKQVAVYAEGGSDLPPIIAYDCDQDRVVVLAQRWDHSGP
jgi:hypothetical protein